ncbi:MAG: ACT domain-containing protein [Candidatus Aenigmatarchaeota archaeon]|nr:ACT domain-containing protein [Candidatus Aenigmarchaeota archaeon]
MRQFEIALQNKPGQLANVCEVLAKSGINIKSVSTEIRDETFGVVKILTEDEKATRKALERAGFNFNEYEVISVGLPDRPGELSKISKKLAESNINIESLQILDKSDGKVFLAMKVDNLSFAKKILEKMLAG